MRHLTINKELKIANSLYSQAGNFGGASININFNKPIQGFMVSVQDGLIYNNLSEVNEHALSNWIAEQIKSIKKLENNKHYYFGSWVDEKTKKVYFDLSLNIASKITALELAKEYNQISIYDIENKKTIYLLKE